jgi:hypothetical protein
VKSNRGSQTSSGRRAWRRAKPSWVARLRAYWTRRGWIGGLNALLLRMAERTWAYLQAQGFANLLQIATILLAYWTFKHYFLPEQDIKRLQDTKAKLEEDVEQLEANRQAQERLTRALESKVAAEAARAASATLRANSEAARASSETRRADVERTRADDAIFAVQVAQEQRAAIEEDRERSRVLMVHFRQREHPRRLQMLSGYIGASCNLSYFVEKDGFVDCAMKRLNEPQFSYAFSRRELDQAAKHLQVEAKRIESDWQLRFQQWRNFEKEQTASCEGLPERNTCITQATARAQSRAGNFDPIIASDFLAKELEAWERGLISRPACPPISNELTKLPPDWPSDCN